jgi:pimeloyl-ACP methyl ester carboxylesterase
VTTFVRSADGRQLAVKMSGNPTGHPVFMLHGTPGSRVGPFPRSRVLYELGVRLISFDRPGYGASDRLDSRRVADVVPDVVAIADTLEVNTFAVLGRSGGGPHALACAALLPDRVTRASVLVSLAPWAAEGLDWFAGMNEPNVREYTAAASEPELLTARLIETAAQIKANPAAHVDGLRPEMPASDRRVVSDIGIRALLAQRHPGSGAALARRERRVLAGGARALAGGPDPARDHVDQAEHRSLRGPRGAAGRAVLADQDFLARQLRLTSAEPLGHGSAGATRAAR